MESTHLELWPLRWSALARSIFMGSFDDARENATRRPTPAELRISEAVNARPRQAAPESKNVTPPREIRLNMSLTKKSLSSILKSALLVPEKRWLEYPLSPELSPRSICLSGVRLCPCLYPALTASVLEGRIL